MTTSLTLSDVDSRTLSGATVRVSVRFPVAVPGVSALQRVGAGRVPAGDGAITANTSPRIAIDATGAGAAAFEVANNTVDGAQGITLTSGTGAIDAEIASNGLAGSAPITVQAGAGAQLRVGGTPWRRATSRSPAIRCAPTSPATPPTTSCSRPLRASASPACSPTRPTQEPPATSSRTGPQFTSCALPF